MKTMWHTRSAWNRSNKLSKHQHGRLIQSLAPLGSTLGLNFIALAMLPLIFIFPFMKASWGLSLPLKRFWKSPSNMMKVASALPFFSKSMEPFPFLRSTVMTVGGISLLLAKLEVIDSANFGDDTGALVGKERLNFLENLDRLEGHLYQIYLFL